MCVCADTRYICDALPKLIVSVKMYRTRVKIYFIWSHRDLMNTGYKVGGFTESDSVKLVDLWALFTL